MTVLEKSGLFFSIGLIIVLLLLMIFADHGLIDYQKLITKEEQVAAQATEVNRTNRAVELEIEKLKTDLDYIKHVAKHEYEMAEEDDMIFKDADPD